PARASPPISMTKWKPSTVEIEIDWQARRREIARASHRTSRMENSIGRVVAVGGSQMTATLEVDPLTEDPVRIGAMVKVRSAHLDVIGTIGAVNAEAGGSPPRSLMVVDLLGEIVPTTEGRPQFHRGVTH